MYKRHEGKRFSEIMLAQPTSLVYTLNISESIWPPYSAQESTKIRSLHQRGKETKKFLFLSSSRLCLMGWGSSSLEILQVCS